MVQAAISKHVEPDYRRAGSDRRETEEKNQRDYRTKSASRCESGGKSQPAHNFPWGSFKGYLSTLPSCRIGTVGV